MDLCVTCDEFVRKLSHNPDWQSNYSELDELEQECHFCDFIASCTATKVYERGTPTVREELETTERQGPKVQDCEERAVIKPFLYDVLQSSTPNLEMTLDIEQDWLRRVTTLMLYRWAEEGSPASGAVGIGTPPRVVDRSSTIKQVKTWLDDCRGNHDACRCMLSGDVVDESTGPTLPKRVLDLGDSSTASKVVLVETKGSRGNYAALSHSWGPPDRMPLRTIKDTVAQHLEGIALDKFPKTFQDAIDVTKAVGLRYLWIDSLCIVQDDEKDWEAEAVQMHAIYAQSTLTIAAAGARDCTEGCFVSQSWTSPSTQIPYYANPDDESPAGVIHLKQRFDLNPSFTPLHERAWVLQEWRLSRRVVYFVEGAMSWKCRDIEVDEFGEHVDTTDYPDWSTTLQWYSSAELAYESDRFIALQGLANEMQKTRNDRYCLGIWTAELPGLLLWMSRTFEAETETEIYARRPSWNWESVPGPKLFWTSALSGLAPRIDASQVVIDNSNALEIRDVGLQRYTLLKKDVSEYCTHHRAHQEKEVMFRRFRDDALYYIRRSKGEGYIISGIAAPDYPCDSDIQIYGLKIMSVSLPLTREWGRYINFQFFPAADHDPVPERMIAFVARRTCDMNMERSSSGFYFWSHRQNRPQGTTPLLEDLEWGLSKSMRRRLGHTILLYGLCNTDACAIRMRRLISTR